MKLFKYWWECSAFILDRHTKPFCTVRWWKAYAVHLAGFILFTIVLATAVASFCTVTGIGTTTP